MSTLITDNVNTGTIKSSGGTTAITIDSSGRVTEPAKPYLFARNAGGQNVTPSGFTGVIPYDTILGNSGISLNTSTFKFTVPVTGLYNISANIRINANRTYLYWAVVDDNGGSPQVLADADGGNNIVMGIGSSSGPGFSAAVGSVLQRLQTSKTYYLRCADSSTTSVAVQPVQTWLHIHLVG